MTLGNRRSLLFHCLEGVCEDIDLSLRALVLTELSACHSDGLLFFVCIACSEHFQDFALVWVESSNFVDNRADSLKSGVLLSVVTRKMHSAVIWVLLGLGDDVTMVESDEKAGLVLLDHLLI